MAPTPATLGPYQLLRRIGGGGMAEIFSAAPLVPGVTSGRVVIKKLHFLLEGQPEYIALFEQEACLLSRLRHRRICGLIAWNKNGGLPYMVLELIEGRNLKQIVDQCRLRQQSVPVGIALLIAEQVCEALHYLGEEAGPAGAPWRLVHRDISPQNIIVSLAGEVKLIDFGIALAQSDPWPRIPDPVQGKIGYMSPEQLLGQRLDHRTDLFSCAVILYELLSGRRLFKRGDRSATESQILTAGEPPIERLSPEAAAVLAPLLGRALARQREARFGSALALQRELARARQQLATMEAPDDLGRWLGGLFAPLRSSPRAG